MSDVMLSIDIGFRNSGVLVVRPKARRVPIQFQIERMYSIETVAAAKKKNLYVADDDIQACRHIAGELMKIIHEHNPVAIFAETPTSGGQSSKAVACMARAQAVLASVIEIAGIPTNFIWPNDSKKSLFGKLKVDKKEVMAWSRKEFPNVAWPRSQNKWEHLADAAMCMVYAQKTDLFRMVARR